MKKATACPACNGNGYISQLRYDNKGECNGAYSKACDDCNRTGIIYVDATEYDRVMTMDVDELAIYLINFAYTYNNSEKQKNVPLSVADVREQLLSKAKY